jgi:adenylate kinase
MLAGKPRGSPEGASRATSVGLVLLGPPGAGKGTQGSRLSAELGLPWLASGDILRLAARQGTELGRQAQRFMARGELLPDDVMDAVMCARVAGRDARRGFILDGYPRTRRQAVALDAALEGLGRSLDAALHFELSDAEVLRRLSGRRSCPTCGSVYHLEFNPPTQAGLCDRDDVNLEQRADDRRTTIKRRLAEYRREAEPLAEHYRERGVLVSVDAAGDPDAVRARMRVALDASARTR